MSLQGPHHSAQKSIRTGTSAAFTSSSKVASVKAVRSSLIGSGVASDSSATKCMAQMLRPTTSEPPTSHTVRAGPWAARTRQAASSTA